MNSRNRFVITNLVLIEFAFLNVVILLILVLRIPGFTFNDSTFYSKMAQLCFVYNVSWLLILLFIREKGFYFNPDYSYIKNFVLSLFFFIGFVATLLLIFKIDYFSRLTFILPIFIFLNIDLFVHKYLLKYLKKRGETDLSVNVLLISSGNKYPELLKFTKSIIRQGYKITGYLDDLEKETTNSLGEKLIGNISSLPTILEENAVDEIFITTSSLKQEKIKSVIKVADNYGIRVKLIPDNPVLIAKRFKADILGDIAIFRLRQSPLDDFSSMVLKRLFDFLFASIVLILLSPIYIIIGVIISLDRKGPIFYTPERRGESGGVFKCYKFRTMSVCDNPLNGTKSTVRDDPRITPIGKLLRKSDLDELPQFFNVLKGEMSVIGPRPHRTILQDDFRQIVNDYMVRSYVKPGITGWAQVNGWRGPTVTDEQKKERIKHDLWYIENWNFWLDIKIIFLTLFGKHHKNAF